MRSSRTDPLRLDALEVPPPWRVALTIAPGKHGLSFEGDPWARDLGEDLDHVVRSGVRTLVCLMEEPELAEFGIPTLIEAARERGLHVIHLPIVDGSVPSLDDARSVVLQLIERKNDSILIHCRGGLGRSGLVAGCLLRAIGFDYETTLARLHAARGPKCPESIEQRAFIEHFMLA